MHIEYGMRIANRFRWALVAALLVFNNVGIAPGNGTVGWANVLLLLGVALAAYVHYRLRQEQSFGQRQVLVISAVQDALITCGVWLTGGYDSHLFVLYYPSLTALGLALRLPTSVAYASVVGVIYAGLSLLAAGGVSASPGTFAVVAERWLALYAVLGLSAWAIRHEQVTRRHAEAGAAVLRHTTAQVQAMLEKLVDVWQLTTSEIDPTTLGRSIEAAAGELGDDCLQIEAAAAAISGRAVSASDRRTLVAQASSQVAGSARDLTSRARPTAVAIEQAQVARSRARDVVEGWSARAQAVGELSAAVRKVADQTNLLAFNANIESIQAGERGKRFAVVADEVRLVAEQAIEMAREIDALSVEMWEGTQHVLDAIDEVGKLMVEASALAQLAEQVGEQQRTDAEALVLAAGAAGTGALDDAATAQTICRVVAGQMDAVVQLQGAARVLEGWAALLNENRRVFDGIRPEQPGQPGDRSLTVVQR